MMIAGGIFYLIDLNLHYYQQPMLICIIDSYHCYPFVPSVNFTSHLNISFPVTLLCMQLCIFPVEIQIMFEQYFLLV